MGRRARLPALPVLVILVWLPMLTLALPCQAASMPSLVPWPAQITSAEGRITIDGASTIAIDKSDTGEVRAAGYLVEIVRRARGLNLLYARAGAPAAILFRRDPAVRGAESYRLDVAPQGITISASGNGGLFYGAVTLAQLMTQVPCRGCSVNLDAMRIDDAPRFAWRGLLLDSARHFQSVATVKSLIDAMALHKLNVLQWHLTDDQGWRIEIKKYPRLTQVGAWRVPAGAAERDLDPKTHEPRLYGGFYTQAEIRDVVAYAAARNITIVPEIEMPGHAMAAIVAYPELGSAEAPPSRVTSDWGILPYLYNTDDKTFVFLEDVLGEVMTLFPGPYIHVGGDEAVKDQWKANPRIQARMKSLGIANENAMQSWFISRIGAFLAKHGRKMIGWDEILEGGIPPDATVMSWRGIEGAIAAAKAGHDTVLSPAPMLYFDGRQGRGADEPPGRGHVLTLEDVYAFDPAPATLDAGQRAHVIGLQANIWTEHIRTDAQVSDMAFPRAAAVAELGWSPAASHDWSSFRERMAAQLDRYRALGIGFANSAFAVNVAAAFDKDRSAAIISLSNQAALGDIRFTLDGTDPKPVSSLYAGPFSAKLPAALKAAAFFEGHALTAPMVRELSRTSLLYRDSRELKLCSERLALALEDDAPLTGKRAVFLADILNPCWIYEKADLDGIAGIEAGVGQVPFNFSIGADRDKIALRAPHTPFGELEIHLDDCGGAPIATIPLAAAIHNDAVTKLAAPLANTGGVHDLCFVFTQSNLDPLWVLNGVQLVPAAVP